MKKQTLIGIISFTSFFIITYSFLKTRQEKQKEKLLNAQQPFIKNYLLENFTNIQSVTLTEIIISPTGIPHIQGYLNHNPELKIDAGIYGKYFSGSLDLLAKEGTFAQAGIVYK